MARPLVGVVDRVSVELSGVEVHLDLLRQVRLRWVFLLAESTDHAKLVVLSLALAVLVDASVVFVVSREIWLLALDAAWNVGVVDKVIWHTPIANQKVALGTSDVDVLLSQVSLLVFLGFIYLLS